MLVHARSRLQRDVAPARVAQARRVLRADKRSRARGTRTGARGCFLHNPGYDVNDEILLIGASYRATLAERELAKRATAGG